MFYCKSDKKYKKAWTSLSSTNRFYFTATLIAELNFSVGLSDWVSESMRKIFIDLIIFVHAPLTHTNIYNPMNLAAWGPNFNFGSIFLYI